jgi:hypothetical protein
MKKSEFTLELNQSLEAENLLYPMESPGPTPRRSLMCSEIMRTFMNKRVLIVDDEPFNL